MTVKFIENASYDWTEDSVRIINTPGSVAKKTYFYVQEIGYFKTFPPYFTERRGLPSFLMLYTVSGRGTLNYEGENYVLEKGMCFLIDCMSHHSYATCDNEEWEFMWLHFYGATSMGYYEEISCTGTCIINIPDDDRFINTFSELIEINKKRENFYELKSSELIVSLLTRLMLINPGKQAGLWDVPDYIKRTGAYIDRHFNEELSLDMLADMEHVSKYHLSREYKRFNGITIQEYIINLRITYAKELLKHSDSTVGDIANLCGIGNVSHFINLFKEREGMTPLIYRKKWK